MWDSLKEQFDIDEEPCNFYMEYSKDKLFRLEESKKFEDRKKTLKELFKKSFWLKNIPECDNIEPDVCIGGCNKGYVYNKISFSAIWFEIVLLSSKDSIKPSANNTCAIFLVCFVEGICTI